MGLLGPPRRSSPFDLDFLGTGVSVWLWLMAGGVAMLATYVALRWVRLAQRRPGLRRSWGTLLLAATALGCGICAAVVLTLAGEPMKFWLGFRTSASLLLWLGAVLGCLPVVLALSYKPSAPGLALCGVVLALVAGALQAGWVAAAGFLPGTDWPPHLLALAVGLMAIGFSLAMVVGLGTLGAASDANGWTSLGSAALLGASLFVGQELLLLGAGLPKQLSSAYQHQLSDDVMNAVGGALVPTMLLVMAGYLQLRRHLRRSEAGRNNFVVQKRRKRRKRGEGQHSP